MHEIKKFQMKELTTCSNFIMISMVLECPITKKQNYTIFH